eukprot:395250-Prorocentrum_minimum.AAC.10
MWCRRAGPPTLRDHRVRQRGALGGRRLPSDQVGGRGSDGCGRGGGVHRRNIPRGIQPTAGAQHPPQRGAIGRLQGLCAAVTPLLSRSTIGK